MAKVAEWKEGERYDLITRSFDDEGQSICVEDEGLCRIYLNTQCTIWAVVDPQDYTYFSKWKWSWSSTPRGKLYARRSIGGGKNAIGSRPSSSLYLHREIQIRTRRTPPSPEHKLVDHKSGNSLDCRRDNLRWSTVSMNNTNIPGSETRAKLLAQIAKSRGWE